MTNREARRKGHAKGHVVQLGWSEGFSLYLTDYRGELDREGGTLTTPYPARAEWFGCLRQAREAAARMRHATGQPWVVTTAPADAKPRRCKAATSGPISTRKPMRQAVAEYAYPCNAPCPDCGSDSTARVGDALRCFNCGNAWPAERYGIVESIDVLSKFYGPEDDGLTDADVRPEPITIAGMMGRGSASPLLDPIIDHIDLLAFINALEDFAAEGLDDDDADLLAASLSHPGAESRVKGVFTP